MRLASRETRRNELAQRAPSIREMTQIEEADAISFRGFRQRIGAYLPAGCCDRRLAISNRILRIYDAPLWNLASDCVSLASGLDRDCLRQDETRLFVTPTPSAGTPFPFPTLTDKNKADLTRCAEDILLAREAHFPATIADLYDPENMPADLRDAHERNDEVLERIYIGRRSATTPSGWKSCSSFTPK